MFLDALPVGAEAGSVASLLESTIVLRDGTRTSLERDRFGAAI